MVLEPQIYKEVAPYILGSCKHLVEHIRLVNGGLF